MSTSSAPLLVMTETRRKEVALEGWHKVCGVKGAKQWKQKSSVFKYKELPLKTLLGTVKCPKCDTFSHTFYLQNPFCDNLKKKIP